MNNLEKVALILWIFSAWFMIGSAVKPSWQLFIFTVLTGFCILAISYS